MCGSECFNELPRTVAEYLKGILIKLQMNFLACFLLKILSQTTPPF